jgi:hypothetical protein
MDRRERGRLYSHQYRCDQIRSINRTMPTAPIREHVQGLLDADVTMAAICEVSNAPIATLSELAHGKHDRINRRLGQRILAVTLPQCLRTGAPRSLVPALGAIRRVQALLALGHTHRTITALLPNRDPSVTMKLVGRQQPGVTFRHLHEAVAAAFEQLSMVPGRSEQTRRRARRRGYKPPLAWDEGSIDLPDAVPHGTWIRLDVVDDVAVRRRMEGEYVRLTQAEATEVVRRMYGQGLSSPQIATRTGLKAERYLTKREWLEAS